MTVTDQKEKLRKMNHNMIQREETKISALSSNNLDKYELLTDEDLDLKQSTVEQAKFEYSPLGKIFNKGLSEEDKKEGLFKRLENIKDKNEELIKAFNTTNKVPKNKANIQNKNLVYDSKHSFVKFKNIEDLSLDSVYNKLKDFSRQITSLKNVNSRTKEKKQLKGKVLKDAREFYNELYYIYNDK